MAFFISHDVMHLIKSAYYIALLWFSCPEQTHLSGVIKVMLEVLSKNCKKGLALLLLLVETFIQVFHFTFYDRSHLHLTIAHNPASWGWRNHETTKLWSFKQIKKYLKKIIKK